MGVRWFDLGQKSERLPVISMGLPGELPLAVDMVVLVKER